MCRPATWKREVVAGHKFDFIDVRDYHDTGIATRLRYFFIYILVIKSFLVYVADIYTVITMLTSTKWSNSIFDSCKEKNGCVPIPFEVGKWILAGSIIFSFLLLAYEANKAKKIIASRDISFAFTNPMASDYYSLRSYDHFCFFCNIENSTKKKDDFAFFIFFTFKEWKRIFLADGPRAVINGVTLYSFFLSKRKEPGEWWELKKYFSNDMVTSFLLVTIIFTVVIFAGSLVLLVVAGICYIPLICYIRGNLKEYCCHKVDKRIEELVKRKHKQLIAKQRKEGDLSQNKNKKSDAPAGQLPQPTLPNVSVEDDGSSTWHLRGPAAPSLHYAGSVHTTTTDYYYSDKYDYGSDYPPMPMYDNAQAYPPGGQGGYDYYPDSYGNEYPAAYGPEYSGQQNPYNTAANYQPSYTMDPRDPPVGGTQYGSEYAYNTGGRATPQGGGRSGGLAYDDGGPEPFVPPSRHGTPGQYTQNQEFVPPQRHGTPGQYTQNQEYAPPRYGTPAHQQDYVSPSRQGTPAHVHQNHYQ